MRLSQVRQPVRRQHIRWCSLALVLMLVLLACQPVAEPAATTTVNAAAVRHLPYPEIGQPGGERVIGNLSLPNSFNPYLASDAASLAVIYQMFSGLTRYDAMQQQLQPDLAESWSSNPEQTEWTLKLRPNLKWSDGQPLTAEDVVFTYQEIINNPQIPNNYSDFWAYLPHFPEIQALDLQTVRFRLAEPFAPFLYNLMAPIVPAHVFRGQTRAVKGGSPSFFQAWGLQAEPASIVVNGPWQLASYVPGQRIELIPNPHYYQHDASGQRLPYLKRMTLLDMQSDHAALLQFQRGEIDTYLMHPSDYDVLAPEQIKEKFTIYNLGPNPSSLFVMFNMSTAKRPDGTPVVDPIKSAWFRNLSFRKALALAIDKQGLIDSVYQGRAVVQIGHLNQHNPFYNTDLLPIAYAPEQALQLLKSAGFSWDQKQRLLDPQGNRVAFDLTTNVGNSERDATCSLLRRAWSKLGVQVNYRPASFSVLIKNMHDTLQWEAMLVGLASNSLEPHFSSSRWRLEGRMHLFNKGNANYWQGQPTTYEPWERDLQSLYQQAAREIDPLQRKRLYWQAQALEQVYLPFLYTVSELNLIAVRNDLGNMRPSVYGGSGLNQINWNSAFHYKRPDS